MGPLRERLCAVFADGRQGSGYVIAPRMVLTAGHVVDGTARVALPGRSTEVACVVVWRDGSGTRDVAVLLAVADLVEDPALFADDTWAEVHGLHPVEGCQAIGFPRAQRGADGGLESEQFLGTLKPGSGLVRGRLVLDGVHTPPARPADGGSPWAGMSGAPVFADGLLVGVVADDPGSWQHGRLLAEPVAPLLTPWDGLPFESLQVPKPAFGRLRPDPVTAFKYRYAEYVAHKHNSLTIFGLDLRDRGAVSWPLDAAYLSLEAEAPLPGPPDGRGELAGGGGRPADEALADRDRVLLRGVAGSGKTTLVQWLAVGAARQELPPGLAHLRDRVPFVLPLRTLARRGQLPSTPAEFLACVGNPLAAEQPPGWAPGVLAAGRGLLLVDGLDEVDARQRDRVRDWLRDLLLAYPGNLWLVTSRPSAVEDGWLMSEGFAELTLSPMSRSGVASFVARWHTAARAGGTDPQEAERLDGYRESLLTAIRTKPDLGRLATNPLMCGMICALHRDRRGYLPNGRKELYDAALAMLTADRDQRRDIGAPDGVELAAEPQIQLLQRLAYWLIRNGRAELSRHHAEHLIGEALPSVPAAAAQGDAAAIFRHLLLRSGLIREPVAGTVDFVHRTFQDYLGARRAVEEWDVGLLVDKAADAQWEDVVRMAVAHARPRERAEILRALLARVIDDPRAAARVTLLAMACLEHATELLPAVRQEVMDRAATLIPPRSTVDARFLADVGPMVLELLPGPEGCPDDETAVATVVTGSLIESDAAIPFLRRFARHPSLRVRSQLAYAWARFDEEEYFEDVIRDLLPDGLEYVARDVRSLDLLVSAGLDTSLQLRGAFRAEDITARLAPDRLVHLHLVDNTMLEDLSFLRGYSSLSHVGLRGCHGIEDFSALRDLTIGSLSYTPVVSNNILRRLPETVHVLNLLYGEGPVRPLGSVRAPGVRYVTVQLETDEDDIAGWIVDCFPSLTWLHLFPGGKRLDLSPLAALTGLTYVGVPRDVDVTGSDALRAGGVTVNAL